MQISGLPSESYRCVKRAVQQIRAQILCAIIGGLAACWMTSGAVAHHSSAEFDAQHPIEITGVVTEWEWMNPHTWLFITVTGDSGATTEWGLEGGPPSMLRARGIQKDTFKAGDRITAKISPHKQGLPRGLLLQIVLKSNAGDMRFYPGAEAPPAPTVPAPPSPPTGDARSFVPGAASACRGIVA